MKASGDLFTLIKSLTQTEKRYFKLFSSLQKGDKNYVKLFDAIDRQKTYKHMLYKAFIPHLYLTRQLILKNDNSE